MTKAAKMRSASARAKLRSARFIAASSLRHILSQAVKFCVHETLSIARRPGLPYSNWPTTSRRCAGSDTGGLSPNIHHLPRRARKEAALGHVAHHRHRIDELRRRFVLALGPLITSAAVCQSDAHSSRGAWAIAHHQRYRTPLPRSAPTHPPDGNVSGQNLYGPHSLRHIR
jgi:hypothetical protein